MILDDIVAYKREELAEQKKATSLLQLQESQLFAESVPSFLHALRDRHGRTIIAEVKKATGGEIRA